MKKMHSEEYKKGWENLKTIDGKAGEKVVASLEDISPDLAAYIIEFAFGDIYERPLLDLKTKEIVIVSGLTAMGNAEPQLKVHLNAALNVGWTIAEVQEIILQMSVYSGFPSAVNGMTALKDILDERKKNGVDDPKGLSKQTKIPEGKTRLDVGVAQLEKLDVAPIDKLNETFKDVSPDFMKYVLEYGFSDILARPGLDYKTREMATISALTALGSTDQLKFHIRGAMNLGVTKEEVAEIMVLMGVFSGFPSAVNGTMALKEVTNE
ncbi:carboxymuconolactone decarboxylase family protein [Flagellimonas marina]|uniref:Carboxymuconolactone decarboxylase family protein n=1 Tax=Flagellimonas marina TaxID=1775168 RepID=A0ABV8PI79_9FLAO